MIFAFKRFAGIANVRFQFGLDNDICFQALSWYIENSRFHLVFYCEVWFQARCWHSEFAFSPRSL